MTVRRGDTVELAIDRMAFGGKGIGRINGLVVFVAGAVPGDRITARIYRKKRDYAEAGIVEILSPSPDRVVPPCPYSGYCGGCRMQQVRYEKQLAFKHAHVAEAMERIGGLEHAPVRPVIPSSRTFGYRNKMEFSFSDRRWYLPGELDRRETEGGFALGLHVPGTFYKVLDVTACLLQREKGNEILREARELVRRSRVPVYGLRTHEGFWRFLTLRYSAALDEWMVNFVTSGERPDIVLPIARALDRKIDGIKTIVNNIHSGKAAVAVGQKEIVLTGDGTLTDRIGPFTFRISANSFFQTNSEGAETIYRQVAAYAGLNGTETVLDLYSGTGTIPIFLAGKARRITGIEINPGAVLDAERNCRENGIRNCRFLCGDMRKILPEIPFRPDVLIIDPPRAGMHKAVLAQVLALSPGKIVYVSCNPATLARDIGEMVRDYDLLEIQPVDMFPHTGHVEAVASLARRKRFPAQKRN